jgi:poly(A) polymerase
VSTPRVERLLADHPVWRSPGLADLLSALDPAGDGSSRIVGGAVRDALLGESPGDVDIATALTPPAVTDRLRQAGWTVIPTGIAFGTVTAARGGHAFQITTLRRDVATDGRRAVVAFTEDFGEDAFRRDFTLNALSATPDGTVFDHATGIADLAARRVRFIGEALKRVREDYLRVLRFFRFRARLSADAPDAEGLAACVAGRDGIRRLSRERIDAEMRRLLVAPHACREIGLMRDAGILDRVVPGTDPQALEAMAAQDAAAGLAPDALLRLGALAGADARAVTGAFRLARREASRLDQALHAPPEPRGWPLALLDPGRETLRDRLRLDAARHRLEPCAFARLLAQLGETRDPPPFPIRGPDLLAAGLEPGPGIGEALQDARRIWAEAGFPTGREAVAAIVERAAAAFGENGFAKGGKPR